MVLNGTNARLDPATLGRFVTALWAMYFTDQPPGISIDPIATGIVRHEVRYIGHVLNTDLGRVMRVAEEFEMETGRPMRIISGHRSIGKQLALKRQGRPAADPAVSNHTRCPAMAVDISIGLGATNVMKIIFGRTVVFNGLRWGGGSCIDRKTGIPSDWNHIDDGPRSGGATVTRPCR